MNIDKWINRNTTSLNGKVVAITGATGGLGSNLCRHIASLGASIIMLDRNMEKSLTLKSRLLEEFPDAQIENIRLDLSQIKSVKEVVEKLKNKKLDFLILNAGVFNVPLKKLDLGYNNIFQVNFISPYFLAKSLLPTLRKSNGKVIVVSSIAHKFAKFSEADIDYSNNKNANKIYGNSKRFLMASLFELFKNEKCVKLVVTHPGVTPTAMTTHYHKAINWLVKFGMKLLFPSPQKAVLNLLAGMFADCDYQEWIGPKNFDVWGKPKKKKLDTCNPSECEQIFKFAEEIYNSFNN